MKATHRTLGLFVLAWLIGSCGDHPTGPAGPTVASVKVSADTATLVPAGSIQLSATALSASGETVPRDFQWGTSDAAKATVSPTGLVIGVAPGSATIFATVDGKNSSGTAITVLDGGIVSPEGTTLSVLSGLVKIVVPPGALSTPAILWVRPTTAFATDPRAVPGAAFEFGPPGTNFLQQVVLKIKYDPQSLPSGTEEAALELYLRTSTGWQSVSQSTVDLTGQVVSASVTHFSTYAILLPEPVAAIAITGAPSLTVGESGQLTATLTASDGRVLSNRAVTWSSSDATIATVGSTGLVQAIKEGLATISVSAGGIRSWVQITVSRVPVTKVVLSAITSPMVVGITQQLTATAQDANGNALSDRSVTWSSSNTGVLTVCGAGLVTAVSPGTATITATIEAVSATTAPITVNRVPVTKVVLSGITTPMVVGATQQLTATAQDASGNALSDRSVTWNSSNTAVLTVSETGLVTAAGPGTATISATSESVSATPAVITVNPAPPPAVATITVFPPSASIVVGTTQQLTATLKDANNNVLAGRAISWSSGNQSVASVDANGLVTALAVGGPVTITANSEGKTGNSSITVMALTIRGAPFITSGLSSPVFLTQPLNDGRIFVVEQTGTIRVVLNGVLQATPFLDIRGKLLSGGERGLLSVAFHPQYALNHFFYIYFTGLGGEIRIERFTTTADPSVADATSEKLIFTTPHADFANHNGGLVAFGPDGMLYGAFGDGGGAGDPLHNGQNFNAYLGGMIRIDIDHGDPYAIPPDNPFVGQTNTKPELWAKGLRNPWRYAFDPQTGLLYIADVGQGLHEEVNVVGVTERGINYGWNTMEGLSCYNATSCNQTGLRLPIIDYGHTGGACSIIGGYVYRGTAMPAVRGHYFYSDNCAGWFRSFRYQNGVAVDQRQWGPLFGSQTSFGEDITGELYFMAAGNIYKIVPGN